MNARISAVMMVVVALLFAAPVGAANVNLKVSGSLSEALGPALLELSYSGEVGLASINARADSAGEAQLKLGISHSFKPVSGSSAKATAAASWHRAARPWFGGLRIAAGDWLHVDAGLTLKAPATSQYRPSAAVDADVRVYPMAAARNYFQATVSGDAQLERGEAATSASVQIGAKLMPGNPKWTAVFGAVGFDAQWERGELDARLKLAARGRAYPESMAKSYASASADLTVSPDVAVGHSIAFSAGATGKGRPLRPELATVAGRASVKWSYTVPKRAAGAATATMSLRPTFTTSAATTATLWHNSPERRSSAGATLKAGVSLPLPGGFSLAADASWRSASQHWADDDEPGEDESGIGDTGDDTGAGATADTLTLSASAKWTGSSTPKPNVSLAIAATRPTGPSTPAESGAPTQGPAWSVRGELVVGCKL